jgi:2-hydroxychromene-2-carboxylate isomerase
MREVTWFFDFISPYAYLGFHALKRLPENVVLRYQPVLFAGLLNHWGQKGPAEIPTKRTWTYRECIWLADQAGVPFRMPATHPFNPLPFLRLAIAAGNTPEAISAIFRLVWTTGLDPADSEAINGLAMSLGIDGDWGTDPKVKNALRESTEQAARRGVFGVPTFDIDGQLFWGSASTDFAAAYLADPTILQTDEVRRADALQVGASR